MDKNSTRFLHYCQIDTSTTDLLSDAFGFEYCFPALIPGSAGIKMVPDERIMCKLMLLVDKMVDK
ncbi:MAG: hypothetical protein KFF49_07925 [Bacteroidales bacterium]|nr:hypothetical protein [Bacteroidales bacterium]